MRATQHVRYLLPGAVLGLITGIIVGTLVKPVAELPEAIGVGAIAGINVAEIVIATQFARRYSWIWLIFGPVIGALAVVIARPLTGQIAGTIGGLLLGASVGIMIDGYLARSPQHQEEQGRRRLGLLLTAALWLIGMGTLHYFGGLSVFTFGFYSLILAACTVHIQRISLWANIGWIAAGLYFIYMSYSTRVHPLGTATWAADWWIAGLLLILVGVIWAVQHAMKLQP